MEINLNIIVDDTLVSNIKALKKTLFLFFFFFLYNWGYNIEAEIWKTTKALKDNEHL